MPFKLPSSPINTIKIPRTALPGGSFPIHRMPSVILLSIKDINPSKVFYRQASSTFTHRNPPTQRPLEQFDDTDAKGPRFLRPVLLIDGISLAALPQQGNSG